MRNVERLETKTPRSALQVARFSVVPSSTVGSLFVRPWICRAASLFMASRPAHHDQSTSPRIRWRHQTPSFLTRKERVSRRIRRPGIELSIGGGGDLRQRVCSLLLFQTLGVTKTVSSRRAGNFLTR